jgi:hypothetical protein
VPGSTTTRYYIDAAPKQSICSIAIARIALYQLALGYDQSDFTYTGSTLYLFTSMEPLLACALACMPLLQPVANIATGSPVVSWAKSLVKSSRSRSQASASHNNGSYVPAGSQEGLHHTAYAIADKSGLGPASSASGDRGIYVNHQVEQSGFEMVNERSGR